MDAKELKALKKQYKSAVLSQSPDVVDMEKTLSTELGDGWSAFLGQVEAFVLEVRKLGAELRERAAAPGLPLSNFELKDFQARARDLGSGAQEFVMREYASGIKSRAEEREKRELALREAVARERQVQDAHPVPDAGRVRPIVPAKPLVEPVKRRPGSATSRVSKADKAKQHAASVRVRRSYKTGLLPYRSLPRPTLERTVILGEAASPDSLRALTVHRNDITTLRASHAWIVCLDESYRGEEGDFREDGPGIIAGVVFSEDDPLPMVPQLHCATDSLPVQLKEADDVIRTLLSHGNCGVLALPAGAQELSLGWEDLLSAWVDVLVRLLPFPKDDEPVTVRLMVEPRSGFEHANQFGAMEFVCMKFLKEAFPERARRLSLSFEPMPKEVGDGKTYNSYPDIVGHTCLCRDTCPTARQRFAASGWNGTCFLNENPKVVRRLLRCLFRSEMLEAGTWRALVAHSLSGIIGGVSARFGERAQTNREEWMRYLGYLDEHLKSGSVDMKRLRREVEWLGAYYPKAGIPDKTRLVWLVCRLALANHEGKLFDSGKDGFRAEFDSLCSRIFDEDAPLVCDATLHLAVAYTNAFEFEMALAVLQALLARERATVGTLAYGKLLSSAGQHFAFLGMPDEAIDHFDRAIACFEKLSDPLERKINVGITRAYRTTTIMDHRPEQVRQALSLYLLGREDASDDDLAAVADQLATTRGDKFKHHILLRHVSGAGRDDPLRKAYRVTRERWHPPESGHPWELIEFYRALLVAPGVERMSHFEAAYRLAAEDDGETMQVIAAVIAGSALADARDDKWLRRFGERLERVRPIPGLAECGRLKALEDQPEAKLPPLELAAKVLPFNFR